MIRPATVELLKAVKLNPQNPDAQYLLGIVSLRQAAEGEALVEGADCRKGEEARLERAEIDQRFREAGDRFQQAIAARSDYSDAWNSLAVVQLHFQRWDQAIASTEKALSNATYQQPWQAQGNLGWALYHRKEFARATKELRTALFSNPQFCVGRYRLARVYFEDQQLDAAAEELERVTADAKCPIQEAYHLLGLVSLKRQDRARASEAFKRCVELAPKSCLARECRIAD
jgi:Tfp pilus assembly protein PilF